MKKTKKGSYDCSTDNRANEVVLLNDTAMVACASNYAGATLECFIKRWLKEEKKKTNVLMSHALMMYNQKIVGVNLFDQFVATIYSKRWWWWLFFTWILNAVMTNALLLYKKIQSKNIPSFAFMRK